MAIYVCAMIDAIGNSSTNFPVSKRNCDKLVLKKGCKNVLFCVGCRGVRSTGSTGAGAPLEISLCTYITQLITYTHDRLYT